MESSTRAQKQNGVIANTVRDIVAGEIMEQVHNLLPSVALNLHNPEKLISTEMLKYFLAYIPELGIQFCQIFTLGEIAELTIPDSFEKSSTTAKMIVSKVVDLMLEFAYFQDSAVWLVVCGYLGLDRKTKFSVALEKLKEDKDSLYRGIMSADNHEWYKAFSDSGRAARGYHLWNSDQEAVLIDLISTELWDASSQHSGRPNWSVIATKFNHIFGLTKTVKQLRDKHDRLRERTES